jgi:hypothetical protein
MGLLLVRAVFWALNVHSDCHKTTLDLVQELFVRRNIFLFMTPSRGKTIGF